MGPMVGLGVYSASRLLHWLWFRLVTATTRTLPMIVPITVTTVREEKLVIDPHDSRRKGYQELGCSYTQASDLAVTDYVDESVDKLANLVQALVEVVDHQERAIDRLERLSKKGKRHVKKAKR